MAGRHNTNDDTTAAGEGDGGVSLRLYRFGPTFQAHGSGPRFRPKPGSVFPVRKKLVQTMMAEEFLILKIRGGSASSPTAGNRISDHRAPSVYPDNSLPPIEPPNGQN